MAINVGQICFDAQVDGVEMVFDSVDGYRLNRCTTNPTKMYSIWYTGTSSQGMILILTRNPVP